jgi:hypothetical protein
MLVLGTSSGRTTGPRSIRRERGGAGFRVGTDAGVAGGAAPAAAGSLSPIAALLTLQDVEHADAAGPRQAIEHGGDVLDRLRDLQVDLLAGRLDRGDLADLAQAAARGVPHGADPALARIVKDIEVRAAVELAKLDVELPDAPVPTAGLPLPEPAATPAAARASCLRAYRDPTAG